MQAKSTITVTTGQEMPFSEYYGCPRLTQGNFTVDYKGDIEARSVLKELKVHFSNNTACIQGLEHVIGQVDGKNGSFVLEHSGKFENGVLSSKRTIVKGSGTGDLEGIRGVIHFESKSHHMQQLMLEYFFE
jgi:hypothetical protein